MTFTVRIDRGQDVGQNFGSLFEVKTEDGRFVIGAGFLGLYNTRFRSDRHTVHFFVRPTTGEREAATERLPRPTQDAGTYMYDLDGALHACSHTQDQKVRVWNETKKGWEVDPCPIHARMHLGSGMLLFDTNRVEYNGEPILTKPEHGTRHRFYYAHGWLCFYHTDRAGKSGYRAHTTDNEGFTKLYACPWQPTSGKGVDLSQAVALTLSLVGETPFAYGQLGTEILTCSNIGGVYVFEGKAWRMVVEPKLSESYQVYSMLNFYDRFLMGQYPTGELFEYDGEKVTRLEGWPPRIPGVRPNAREAQTTVIYGGDLFVGVWPWGELWRYSHDTERWSLQGRMFTHPEATDATTHPYENGCRAHKLVTNQWGQRVTSLVPIGDSLMVSTSAKWPCKWEPKFDFLPDGKWQEYGAVIRLRLPGNLCAPLRWTDGPTVLQFTLDTNGMHLAQDGRKLTSTKHEGALAKNSGLGAIAWGRGVFGPFGGVALNGEVTRAE